MKSEDQSRNLVAAICYIPILTIVISIVVFFVEQEDKFVRFHALQAFLFSIFYYFVVIVLGRLPFILFDLPMVFFLIALVIWIFAIFNTYRGKIFKFPIIGHFAEKKVK